MPEVWVAGYPSFVGGAGVELDRLIDLWRSYNVEVNLVPFADVDPAMKTRCDRRGCVTHAFRPDVFAGKVVVAFCNRACLQRLPEIERPRLTVWAGCMTFPVREEIRAHEAGLIDLFIFQTPYQRRQISSAL